MPGTFFSFLSVVLFVSSCHLLRLVFFFFFFLCLKFAFQGVARGGSSESSRSCLSYPHHQWKVPWRAGSGGVWWGESFCVLDLGLGFEGWGLGLGALVLWCGGEREWERAWGSLGRACETLSGALGEHRSGSLLQRLRSHSRARPLPLSSPLCCQLSRHQ